MEPADVKRIRHQCGLTQADLADMLGVTRNAVNLWEMGARKVDGPTKILLALIRAVRTHNRPALAKILGRFRVKTELQRRKQQ